MLYPLFVHNIGALLYHPTNQNRTSQVMASAERRKQEQSQMRSSQSGPGLAPIQQHHHHTLALPGPQQSLPSHSTMNRPALDRAHTFPTPPTNASSVMGSNMGSSDGFQWTPQSQGIGGTQSTNPISIDTGLSNARSMPATPASTPPGTAIQSIQSYQSGAQQQYDNSRPMYNQSSAQQSPYQQTNPAPQDRSVYGHHDAYGKNDMGPPSSRPPAQVSASEQKPVNGIIPPPEQNGQNAPHASGEEEAEHEHETEYTHDSGAYDASRTSYNYAPPPVGSLSTDHQHLAPEMTGSSNHAQASGRATPRTAAPPQPYYSQPPAYNTSPRVQHQPSSNLYSVMSNNDRGATNGGGNDVYAPPADMNSMSNGYPSQQPLMNGAGGIKRGRDEEDDLQRPMSGGANMEMKRRKTLIDSTLPAGGYDSLARPASATVAPTRHR